MAKALVWILKVDGNAGKTSLALLMAEIVKNYEQETALDKTFENEVSLHKSSIPSVTPSVRWVDYEGAPLT